MVEGPLTMNEIAVGALHANMKMRDALLKVRDELRERIDGGEECRAQDSWISDLIRTCEAVL